MNERVSIGGEVAPRGSGMIAIGDARVEAETDAPTRSHAIGSRSSGSTPRSIRLTNMRGVADRKRGTPGPEGSVGKLAMAELNQRLGSFVVNADGPDASSIDGYPIDRPTTAIDLSNPLKAFLRVQANSIEGGTSNIMRNILGERVLGLPGEPRADKDQPWSEVPRS